MFLRLLPAIILLPIMTAIKYEEILESKSGMSFFPPAMDWIEAIGVSSLFLPYLLLPILIQASRKSRRDAQVAVFFILLPLICFTLADSLRLETLLMLFISVIPVLPITCVVLSIYSIFQAHSVTKHGMKPKKKTKMLPESRPLPSGHKIDGIPESFRESDEIELMETSEYDLPVK